MLKTDITDINHRNDVDYDSFQVYSDIDGTMYDHDVNRALGEALQYFGITSINAHSNMGQSNVTEIVSKICDRNAETTRPEIFAKLNKYGVTIDRVVTKWDLAYPMTDEDHAYGKLGIGYQRLYLPLFNFAFPNGIDGEGAMTDQRQFVSHGRYKELAQKVIKISAEAGGLKAGNKTIKGAMLEMVVNELFPEKAMERGDVILNGNANPPVKRLLFLEDSHRDADDMQEAAKRYSSKAEIGIVHVKNDNRHWLQKEELISAFIDALVKEPYEKQLIDLLRQIETKDLLGMVNTETAGGWQYQKHLTQKQKFAALEEFKQKLPDFQRRIHRAICKIVIMPTKNTEKRDIDILNGAHKELKSLLVVGNKSPAFARTGIAKTIDNCITQVEQLHAKISEEKYAFQQRSEVTCSTCI